MHFTPFLRAHRALFMLQALVNTWEETARGTFPYGFYFMLSQIWGKDMDQYAE